MKRLSELNVKNCIKILFCISLAAFLVLFIVWLTPSRLRLQIAIDENARATDKQQITILVSLVNNLHHEITFNEWNPEHDFVFSLIGPKGNKVPLTEYGKRITDPSALILGMGPFRTIGAGEEKRYSVRLDKLYELDTPGTYTVSATVSASRASMLARMKVPIAGSNQVHFRWELQM